MILLSAAVPQVLCRTLFVAPAVFEPCLTTVFAILPLLSVNLVVKRSSSPAKKVCVVRPFASVDFGTGTQLPSFCLTSTTVS